MPKFVFLWTDIALWLMVLGALAYAWHVRRSPNLRSTWSRVARDTPAMCSAVVLAAFALVGLLDSVHYRPQLPPAPGAAADAAPVYAPAVKSALDGLLRGSVLTQPEKTYSSPLAVRQFTKETLLVDDKPVRDFPRLRAAGTHLADPDRDHLGDVYYRLGLGLAAGLAVSLIGAGLLFACLARRGGAAAAAEALLGGRAEVPWRAMAITFTLLCLVTGALAGLSSGYHALGTDRIGNDVLWQALKSIRTDRKSVV